MPSEKDKKKSTPESENAPIVPERPKVEETGKALKGRIVVPVIPAEASDHTEIPAEREPPSKSSD